MKRIASLVLFFICSQSVFAIENSKNPFEQFVGEYRVISIHCKAEYPDIINLRPWENCDAQNIRVATYPDETRSTTGNTIITVDTYIFGFNDINYNEYGCKIRGKYNSKSPNHAEVGGVEGPMDICRGSSLKPGSTYRWNVNMTHIENTTFELSFYSSSDAFDSSYLEDIKIRIEKIK